MSFDWLVKDDLRSIAESIKMLRPIKLIYEKLFTSSSQVISVQEATRYLKYQINLGGHTFHYRELMETLLERNSVSPGFIERFCLSKCAECVLEQHSLNIASAYAVAYIMLNRPTSHSVLHFKIMGSGLLSTIESKDVKITDIEEISKFVINDLVDKELLHLTDNNFILLGKNCKLWI